MTSTSEGTVYLDHAATTPVRPEVREAMRPFLSERFGNPSSPHRWGREAALALEDARARVAAALGADAARVVFTRGGTESDNLALQGRCRALAREGAVPTLVVSSIEHAAVRETARALSAAGLVDLEVLEVTPAGELDLAALEEACARDVPVVASVMWVNNEVGMILPVHEVAARVRDAGGTTHTDAVQAVGKVPVSMGEAGVDLLTVTGHKIYGPKGAGALVVRAGVALAPILHGGGQEGGLRPGTQDVAGAVGLAVALELAVAEQEAEARRLTRLRRRCETELRSRLPGARLHAEEAPRAPHIVSVGIEGVEADAVLAGMDLEGVAVSAGSACRSGAASASPVLEALYGPRDGYAAIRFSMGRHTTEADIVRAVEAFCTVLRRLGAAGEAA